MVNPEPEMFGHPQISYRRLGPSDLDTLEHLHDELFPTRLDPDFYRDVVNGHNIVSWGAVDSNRPDALRNEIIGYVTAEVIPVGQSEIADMLGHFYARSDDTVVYVMTLGVVHKYRNLGIASSLLQRVIDYASYDLPNCLAVYLHAVAINKPAVKLYKKMSFKCVKRLRGYYPIHGEYFDAFIFLLYLREPSCAPLFFREVFTSIFSYMVSGMKSVSLRQ